MAAEGEHSIFYRPVNAVWESTVEALGMEETLPAHVPEHVVMSFFVVFLCAAIFIPLGRSLKKDKPGSFQQMMELPLRLLPSPTRPR